MKKRIGFNVWLNRILFFSFFSIVSISTYTIYMKYFYVATQPFEIYVEDEEIEQILKDYENETGGFTREITDEIEYCYKNDITVHNYEGKRFAIKYLLDGSMEISSSFFDRTVYRNKLGDVYYFDFDIDIFSYKVNPRQKYKGETKFTFEEILELIEEGKWIGKYQGLDL